MPVVWPADDDIADIHLMQADAAGHRRDDAGIAQIDAAVSTLAWSDSTMPSSDCTRAAWVASCWSEMAFCVVQRLIARQVDLGVGEIGVIARQLALRLVQRRLIGARIDLGEQVAGLHHLAFGEIELDQHAADLRPHRGGGQRRHRAQRIERDIDVAV